MSAAALGAVVLLTMGLWCSLHIRTDATLHTVALFVPLASLALGFDLVGAFTLLIGFFAGNRGPVRFRSESASALFGQRLVRWATPREREETLNLSAVLVSVGFVLIVVGLALDPRYSLF